MPHSFWEGETFGVRQFAAAFKKTLEKQAHWAVFESGENRHLVILSLLERGTV
jgi:hypothetical protein